VAIHTLNTKELPLSTRSDLLTAAWAEAILGKQFKLRSLTLADCGLVDAQCISFFAKNNTVKLMRLTIERCALSSDASLNLLVEASAPELRELCIHHCTVSANALAHAVRRCFRLTTLRLGGPMVTDLVICSLSPRAFVNDVVISGAMITPISLLELLRRTALTSLTLKYCQHLKDLPLDSSFVNYAFTSLSLYQCENITDRDVAILLRWCPQLKRLDCSYTRVTEELLLNWPMDHPCRYGHCHACIDARSLSLTHVIVAIVASLPITLLSIRLIRCLTTWPAWRGACRTLMTSSKRSIPRRPTTFNDCATPMASITCCTSWACRCDRRQSRPARAPACLPPRRPSEACWPTSLVAFSNNLPHHPRPRPHPLRRCRRSHHRY